MSDTNAHDHESPSIHDTQDPSSPEAAASETVAVESDTPGDLERLTTELSQVKDQLLRKVAEFENFKRRTREEKDMLMKYGAEGVLRDLLPVLDDFDRSIAAAREHNDLEALKSGIEIIQGKLLRVLENRGLRPIDAMGKPFDVDFHDALLQMPSAEAAPGTILDVVEKGYMLHDRVIRHAKVTVASDTPAQNTDASA